MAFKLKRSRREVKQQTVVSSLE